MTRILLTGASGQLGRAVIARAGTGVTLRALGHADLDIRDAGAVRQEIESFRPDVLINAAAYTAVDRAESEPEMAFAVNAAAPRLLADTCRAVGARLLHLSTDFVFDGRIRQPYAPDAPTRPLGVYGRSKREGEVAVMDAAPELATIVRTSWVYGPGGKNFVRTMLRLLAERDTVDVVSDQFGSPTHTHGLADVLLHLAQEGTDSGDGSILHWSDGGIASWYDVAEAVRMTAAERWPGLRWGSVRPISTEKYPTAAQRPAFSVLAPQVPQPLLKVRRDWRERLRAALLTEPEQDWLPA